MAFKMTVSREPYNDIKTNNNQQPAITTEQKVKKLSLTEEEIPKFWQNLSQTPDKE